MRSTSQKKKRRILGVIIYLLFVSGVVLFARLMMMHINLSEEKRVSEPVVGNLGGVPVEIPPAYALFVEYDGDPHFMERGGWKAPQRNYESKLRSFGFAASFPDMVAMKRYGAGKEKSPSKPWLSVSVRSGENYNSDKSLQYLMRNFISGTCGPDKCFTYVPLPHKTYGLAGYTPKGFGIDVKRRDPKSGLGADPRDKNIYIGKEEGEITTFIQCSNARHENAFCQQSFNLGPKMKAHVKVSYRKTSLPHWRKIQTRLSDLFYEFEAIE